jgi:cytidylate kinase
LSKHVVVAIDGPAGSGKSTLARRAAARLGYLYIDTGAMYRAVALWARRLDIDWTDGARLEQLARSAEIALARDGRVFLNGEDVSAAIREPDMSEGASRVAAQAGVRKALVEKQRAIGAANSVVMEGRDIGTVVFPEAQVKVFLDARPEVRAERRARELRERGREADIAQVMVDLRERDERDSEREMSPLMQAPDAALLDTTGLAIDEVEEELLRIVREKTSNGKEVQR